MPTVPLVQVDAFAERAFEGNPAAVVRLDRWLPDALLSAIAMENNLSETAFVVGVGGSYDLRWFTPTVEVDLCGHATLAAGSVVLGEDGGMVATFQTRSGPLRVTRVASGFELDLPAHPHGAEGLDPGVAAALGRAPLTGFTVKALHHATYWLAIYASADDIVALAPDFGALGRLHSNVICTAPGTPGLDFVSRFFGPGSGVDEDPVTGSAHATLAPYWAARLGRTTLSARQLSRRGGNVHCQLQGDRVLLRGGCVEVIRGSLRFDD